MDPQKVPQQPTPAPSNPTTPPNQQPLAGAAPAPQPPTTPTPQQTAGDIIPPPPKAETALPPNLAAWASTIPQQNSAQVQHSAQTQKNLGHLKSFVSFAAFVGCILVAAFLINQFVFQSYFVQGLSMTPTLQNNDRLIIEKVSRTFMHIQGKSYIPARGQVVVLDSSFITVSGQHEQLIKRVIALPGETITIKDGIVTVKNAEHPQGFNVDAALGLNLAPTYISQPYEATIPADEVFVMGDNRAEGGSHDSRMFGPVHSKDLEGRLWARILPVDKAQVFSVLRQLGL